MIRGYLWRLSIKPREIVHGKRNELRINKTVTYIKPGWQVEPLVLNSVISILKREASIDGSFTYAVPGSPTFSVHDRLVKGSC